MRHGRPRTVTRKYDYLTGYYDNSPYDEGLTAALDFVICGGESGPNARPMEVEWVRGLRDQCQAAGVPFYLKQLGGRGRDKGGHILDGREWRETPKWKEA